MSATTIQVRLDKQTKNQAQKIFGMLDISMSEAVKLFLRQVVLQNGLPFEIKIPNALTDKTLRKSEAGKGLHKAASIGQLVKELEA